MSIRSERGAVNILLVPLVLVVVFFIGAMSFAFWAYNSRQDYKNNSDEKVATAVVQAKQDQTKVDTAAFTKKENATLTTYTGPSAYGSINVMYPKTWSAYIDDTGNSDPYINGYFYPGVVPDTSSQTTAFALRVQVVQESYSNVLKDYQGQVQSGAVKVSAYSLPKVPSVIGSEVDGQIQPSKTGTMIVLPLRDKTLKIWTEAAQFTPVFTTNILPNLTFSP